ncbi:MAG: hypothetical protein AAGA42_16565, partial [Actinomycetota bacterium]
MIGAIAVAAPAPAPAHADQLPEATGGYRLVEHPLTLQTDDRIFIDGGELRYSFDVVDEPLVKADLHVRIDHGDTSDLTIEFEAGPRRAVVAERPEGTNLGAGPECSDPLIFDANEPWPYDATGAPRVGRVRPEPSANEAIRLRRSGAIDVLITDDREANGGVVDCVGLQVTSLIPTGNGVYKVSERTDHVAFDDQSLTLREAMFLAEWDRVDSTIILSPDDTYVLANCDGLRQALVERHVDERLTIIGQGSQILQSCDRDSVIHSSGTVEVRDATIGPSSEVGIIAYHVELRGATVAGNMVGIDAGGDVLVVDGSEVSHNGVDGPTGLNGGIEGDTVRIVDSVVRNNAGAHVGGVFAEKRIETLNSVIADNRAANGSAAVSAVDVSMTGTIVAGNDSRLAVIDAATAEVVHSTISDNSSPALHAFTLNTSGAAIFGRDGTTASCTSPLTAPSGDAPSAVDDASCAGDGDVITTAPNLASDDVGYEVVPQHPSPLIDLVPAERCAVTVDLFGTVRPQRGACDAGAIEVPAAQLPDLPPNASPPSSPTSPFVALSPERLLDSRLGERTVDGRFAGIGRLAAGETIAIDVAGRGGVDPDAVAAFLNVTAVNPDARGFLTVFPCGSPRPLASNVNYQPGQATPNAVLAKIGDDGQVCVYTHAATDLVIDANGLSPAGAYDPSLSPERLLDSRLGERTV